MGTDSNGLSFQKLIESKFSVTVLAVCWTIASAFAGYLAGGYFEFQKQADIARDNRALEFEAARLKEFWWPVYLRLKIDSSIWEKIASNNPDPNLKEVQADLVDKFLIPNHDEIVKIIRSEFALGATSMKPELQNFFLEYVDHVAVFHALREQANKKSSPTVPTPATLGIPFPGGSPENGKCYFGETKSRNCFVGAVEENVLRLQREYDQHLKTLFHHVSVSSR